MLVLMLICNCTEVSAYEILTGKPCAESPVLLLEAGEDSKKQGSEMEMFVTMKMSGLSRIDDDEDDEDVETWKKISINFSIINKYIILHRIDNLTSSVEHHNNNS